MARKNTATENANAAVPIPKNNKEMADLIEEAGREKLRLDAMQTSMNERIASIKSRAEEKAFPHQERLDALINAIWESAEAHRKELTAAAKSKTVRFATGEVAWRDTPPKVHLANMEKVIQKLLEAGKRKFLRPLTGFEINKKAILEHPEEASAIRGISIKQDEMFIISPVVLREEITEAVSKLKKRVSKKRKRSF